VAQQRRLEEPERREAVLPVLLPLAVELAPLSPAVELAEESVGSP